MPIPYLSRAGDQVVLPGRTEKWRVIIVCAVIAVLLTLAWTVWPTPYAYSTWKNEQVRTNRFTGRAELLGPWGWEPMTKKSYTDPNAPPPGFTEDVK